MKLTDLFERLTESTPDSDLSLADGTIVLSKTLPMTGSSISMEITQHHNELRLFFTVGIRIPEYSLDKMERWFQFEVNHQENLREHRWFMVVGKDQEDKGELYFQTTLHPDEWATQIEQAALEADELLQLIHTP